MEKKNRCRQCGVETAEVSHGMCPDCYLAWYCGFQIDSHCECCGFGDRRMLVRRLLERESPATLCGNCSVLLGKRMIPLEQLRSEIFPAGDRRAVTRRRAGERRRRDRRNPGDMRGADRGTAERRKRERRAG